MSIYFDGSDVDVGINVCLVWSFRYLNRNSDLTTHSLSCINSLSPIPAVFRYDSNCRYKDRQKREAVIEMKHVVDALSLHNAVFERAKELFAGFRDDRELVQQFKGVLASCLCLSFDQLSII